jgi:hypothetical protein
MVLFPSSHEPTEEPLAIARRLLSVIRERKSHAPINSLDAHSILHPRLIALVARADVVAYKIAALGPIIGEGREACLDGGRYRELSVLETRGDGALECGGDAEGDGTVGGGGEEAEMVLAFVVLRDERISVG